MAGHIDAAVRLIETAASPHPSDWQRHQAAGRVVTPFLLAAASGAVDHTAFSSTGLGQLVAQIDQAVRPFGLSAAILPRLDADPGTAPPEPRSLSDLLQRALADLQPAPPRQADGSPRLVTP